MQTIRGRRSHVSIHARVCTSREYLLHPAFLPSQVYLFVSNPPSTTPLLLLSLCIVFFLRVATLFLQSPYPRLRICFYVIFKYNLYLLSTFTFTFSDFFLNLFFQIFFFIGFVYSVFVSELGMSKSVMRKDRASATLGPQWNTINRLKMWHWTMEVGARTSVGKIIEQDKQRAKSTHIRIITYI